MEATTQTTATAAGFGERKAPEAVLQQLREIDPNADLVYLGGSEWLLGVRAENHAAKRAIERQLAWALDQPKLSDPLDAAEQAKRIQLLQLYASGFRPVHIYSTPEESVEDFRERDHRWRTDFDGTIRDRLREASLEDRREASEARLMDYIQAETGFLHRHFFRGAKSFMQRVSPFN